MALTTSNSKFPNLPMFPPTKTTVETKPASLLAAMTPTSEPDKSIEPIKESAYTDIKSTTDVSSLLSERGTRYGEFMSHARITQAFKLTSAEYLRRSNVILAPDQKEALDMIFHKIGRIINGDPNYADSWIDIAGYAKLVSDRLEKEQGGLK